MDVTLTASLTPGKTPFHFLTVYATNPSAPKLQAARSLAVYERTNTLVFTTDQPTKRALEKGGDISEGQSFELSPVLFREMCRESFVTLEVRGAHTRALETKEGELQPD